MEYATANDIGDEPSFAWWIPFTLNKQDNIISAVKQSVKMRTHKYGIGIPRPVEEAYLMDKHNINTL